MPLCVALQADGTLIPTGQAVDACTGYVLHTAAESVFMTQLVDLFAWPEPSVLTSWLMGAFFLILTMNAAGYIVGAVVKMVSTDRD
jgi:hypothetical protein